MRAAAAIQAALTDQKARDMIRFRLGPARSYTDILEIAVLLGPYWMKDEDV